MEQYLPYLTYIITAIVVILVLKFILHFRLKRILGFIINIVVGGVVLHFLNYLPFVSIPLDIITSILVGFTGMLGVIALFIYYTFIK